MKVHDKIRFMRQSKGWSQEDMAEKLYMSVNGYANIERGATDVKISRLQQIADTFGIELIELFSFGEKNVFYIADNSSNDNSYDKNNLQLNFSDEKLKHELEKSQLLLQQEKETAHLKERNNDLKEIINDLKEIISLMKKEEK